jgi:membrane protease YdiL (CAAX protease family)
LETRRLIPGLVLVVASMVVLFTVPAGFFAAATILSTSCMMLAARYAGGLGLRGRVRPTSVMIGVVSAALLYLVYFAGGAAVDAFHPFGMTSASESAIYSLIASPSNPVYLQAVVLLFDSAGYESFFRGVLQAQLQPRFGAYSAPAIALLDAAIHVITLNPIWIGGTFVSDLVWGLAYHYGKGTQASFTSHILWDLAIFIIRPVT